MTPSEGDMRAIREALALLKRYRSETPLGHQPHMIAAEADRVIIEAEKELDAPMEKYRTMTHWANTKSVKGFMLVTTAFITAVLIVAYVISPAVFVGLISVVAARALVNTARLEVEVFPPKD